jgi:iron complex transport system substrate-binding protein
VAALVRQGVDVHAFNQRTVAEIFDMIRMLGAMVGAADRADRLADELAAELAGARQRAAHLTRRPKGVFRGMGRADDLRHRPGIDISADRTGEKSAKERFVAAEEISARAPDIIIGSWCGKKFRPK